MNRNREKTIITSFEGSVKALTKVFQGKQAFNFSHELELTAFLLTKTREADNESVDNEGVPISLARMEWSCVPGKSIDMVILMPGSERKARCEWWGEPRSKLCKNIPLLAAIQMKRGGGSIVNKYLTEKDLKALREVQKTDSLGNPLLYFIEYADEDLKAKDGKYETYLQIKELLKKWCDRQPEKRRVFLISRDQIGFAFPKGKWLVNPLPRGTKETR